MNSAKHLSPKLMKGRKAPPSHSLVKIQSFSLLSKAKDSLETFTSEEFEAGGYKWNMCIYPTGNKKKDGQDHISIYLKLVPGMSFPIGWEVNAIVNFFAYDFLSDEYVSTQDGRARRFHVLQTEWGIPKFIDLATFNDPLNGYLKNDTCVFGAEVFIVNPTSRGEYLSLIPEPMTSSYTWIFENFSKASFFTKYESEIFVVGNHKWKLLVYPNGTGNGKDNNVALFLSLINSSLQPNTKLYVYYILRVKNQKSWLREEHKCYAHFSNSSCSSGTCLLVPLAILKDPTNGFLVGNTCIFEVEVKVLGSLKPIH